MAVSSWNSVLHDRDVALLMAPITTIDEHANLILGAPDGPRDNDTVRDLVDRLAVYNVTYLTGGSVDYGSVSPYRGRQDVSIHTLIRDLTRVANARLNDALIALLLRHPEYAPAVCTVFARMSPGDHARRLLIARLLASAALQQQGGAALTLDGIEPQPMDVAELTACLGLPSAHEDGGEALLQATAELLSGPVPVDWIDGWKDVLQHVLREVHWARHPVGAK